jgi:hypothetical protein
MVVEEKWWLRVENKAKRVTEHIGKLKDKAKHQHRSALTRWKVTSKFRAKTPCKADVFELFYLSPKR